MADRHELSLDAVPPPLRLDEGGVARVGRGRVSLDVVVEQYVGGATPEDVARAYDTLRLADVYAVIAYYLGHRAEVDAYLARRAGEARALQSQVEADRPGVTRADLLARRDVTESGHAPAGR